MEVRWSARAEKDLVALARADQRLAERIFQGIERFGTSGEGDVKKLVGGGERWRLRIGDWRIIFKRRADEIEVLRVANRRDAYR